MTIGTEVVYKKDPSQYGPMRVTHVRSDGLLECMTVAEEDVYHFGPHELDEASGYFVTPVAS